MEGILELNRKGSEERKGDFKTTEHTEGILELNQKGAEKHL